MFSSVWGLFLHLLRHAGERCHLSVAKCRGCRNNLDVFLWKKLEGNESRRIFASSKGQNDSPKTQREQNKFKFNN